MSFTATKTGDGRSSPSPPDDRRPPAPIVDGRSRPSTMGASATTPATWFHVADLVNRQDREIAQIRAGLARICAEGLLGDPDGPVRQEIRRILAEARGEAGRR